MTRLTADCLEEIFEHLENEIFTLCSCLLVNRLSKLPSEFCGEIFGIIVL